MQQTEIITDETLRELTAHGKSGFPFAYYSEEIDKYEKGYVEWHWHNEFEWLYAKRGTVYCHIAANEIRLDAGDAIFINSRTIHKQSSDNGSIADSILYMPEFISANETSVYSDFIKPVILSGCLYFVFKNEDPRDKSIIMLLKEAFKNAKNGNDIDIKVSVLSLWNEFFKYKENEIDSIPESKDIHIQTRTLEMVRFIEKNYREKILLENIAKAGGVSKSEALRCFHAMFGTTPIKFLTQYRLNRAKDMLLSTDCSVTRAALECGIDNISYFVRIFSKEFEMTPKKFCKRRFE